MNHVHRTIKDVVLVSICASVLFVQQLALAFLPNVQFSVMLVILYTRVLGFKRTMLIVLVHVLAVNLFSPMGPILPVFFPAMLIAWMIIPITLTTVLRRLQSSLSLALFAFFYGFVYGWVFIPFAIFLADAPFIAYLLADLLFEFIMGVSGFLTTLWLYDPLRAVFEREKVALYEQRTLREKGASLSS
ncbi:MAG: hypothetical protein ACLFTZ_04735 [Acholeplasmataceae bacterium]